MTTTTESTTEARSYCTFTVNDLYFGVPVERVQEVLRYQPMTRVPLAPEVVEGLINLRGRIVVAVDLRRRLGMPERSRDRQPMNVVIRTDDGAVSLLVDEISDVIEVSPADWESRPGTVQGIARDVITGAYKISGKLLLELDTARAIDSTPAGTTAGA